MSTMTGMFHITLTPSTDEAAFVSRMTDVFEKHDVLQLTRTTAHFTHVLLKKQSDIREYVWEVRVDLVTDHPYDFAENLERVQKTLDNAAVVSGLQVYTNVGG